MKESTYYRILLGVVIVCLVLTVAHVVYAAVAYHNSSIIQFVARELW